MKNSKVLRFFPVLCFLTSGLFSCSPSKDPVYHSIVYEYNSLDDLVKYLEDGTIPPVVINGDYRGGEFVTEGETATEPDITWEGIKPVWYLTADYSGSPFDFSTPITENTKLWAKWGAEHELKGVRWYSNSVQEYYEIYDGDFLPLTRKETWDTVPSYLDDTDFTTNFIIPTQYQSLIETKSILGVNYLYVKANNTAVTDAAITVKVTSTDSSAVSYIDTLKLKIKPCNRTSDINFNPTTKEINFTESGKTQTVNLDEILKITHEDGSKSTFDSNDTVYYEILNQTGSCAKIEKKDGKTNIVFSDPGDTPQTITVVAVAQNSDDGDFKTSTITFTIKKTIVASDFTISPTDMVLFYKDSNKTSGGSSSKTINVTFTPKDATDKQLTWASNPETVATVTDAGVVTSANYSSTGAAPIKEATITATHARLGSKTCSVKVVMPVEEIKFDNDTIYIKKEETGSQTPTILPATATEECKKLTWTSSNPSVATVNSDGEVTAISSGKTTITAKADSTYDTSPVSKSYTVIVPESLQDVTIDKKYIFLAEGYLTKDTIKLNITPTTAIEGATITCTPTTSGIVNVTQSSDKTVFNIEYNKAGITELAFTVKDIYNNTFEVTCYVKCYDFTPTDNVAYTSLGSNKYSASAASDCSGHVSISDHHPSYPSTSVTEIASKGFRYTEVTDVFVPSTVTTINSQAFYSCNKLSIIIFPIEDASLVTIGEEAFKYDSSSFSGSGISYIGLQYCQSLQTIGNCAFQDQASMSYIELPASLNSIGNKAFMGCTSLSSIVYQGTKAQWKAISRGTDWHKNVKATTVKCTDGDISLDAK